MKNKLILGVAALLGGTIMLLNNSCKKHEIAPDYSKAQINFKLVSGANQIEWDTIKYTNAAGNKYSVKTANFYVSGITLKKSTGASYISKKVFYVDPASVTKSYFKLDSIPPGNYTEISFNLGLASTSNNTVSLAPTGDNLNMRWPDSLGGGYHFLKLDGYFLDTVNVKRAYQIHLGKNNNLPVVKVTCAMNQKYWNHQYTVKFDVNEVFTAPYVYNLNFDKKITMTDSLSMNRIKNNIGDAFSISQDN